MKKESVNNIVGTNVMYGRARRIEFVERVTYVVIAIIAVILVFVIVGKNSSYNDKNVNFNLLRTYLEDRGFRCEMLYRPGGTCSLTSEVGLTTFTRYESGFEYIVKSEGYFLNIRYSTDKGDYITFKTTAYALAGYRNKTYTCYYKDDILSELDYCETDDKTRLDSNAYNGIVEKAMYDLSNMIDNSGYRRDRLIEDHEWIKK